MASSSSKSEQPPAKVSEFDEVGGADGKPVLTGVFEQGTLSHLGGEPVGFSQREFTGAAVSKVRQV